MFRWLRRWSERLLAIFGAILFSQAPFFIQQYQQQLVGRIDELAWQVDIMTQAAQKTGKSVQQFVEKFTNHSDLDISNQGAIMQIVVERYEKFQAALLGLQSANLFSKPFVFIHHINWDVAKSTYRYYQAGLPFTIEALVYALVGFILGYGFLYGIGMFISAIIGLFRTNRVRGKIGSRNEQT